MGEVKYLKGFCIIIIDFVYNIQTSMFPRDVSLPCKLVENSADVCLSSVVLACTSVVALPDVVDSLIVVM